VITDLACLKINVEICAVEVGASEDSGHVPATHSE
jgi:hypothetical protein